jgi:hypothetical protein
LSTPSRVKVGLPAALQQFQVWEAQPFVSFGWFEPLAQPALRRNSLNASEQQFFGGDTQVITASLMTSWFTPLSEPTRTKTGVKPAAQQFFVTDSEVIPSVLKHSWYSPLSEPVRFKQGLHASKQQFLAEPSRLLPTPNITGTMNASEFFDTFLGGGRTFNRPNSAEMGILVDTNPHAEMAVSPLGPSGLTAKMTISIL